MEFGPGFFGDDPHESGRESECHAVPRAGGTMTIRFEDLPGHFPRAVVTIDWDYPDEELYPSNHWFFYRDELGNDVELKEGHGSARFYLKWGEGRETLTGTLEDFSLVYSQCGEPPRVLPITLTKVRQ